MTDLKTLRIARHLTQQQAAEKIGISLRSYISYEKDESKASTTKYRFLLQEMERLVPLDEEHGVLSIEGIKDTCKAVFDEYGVDFCYLFGSYAKGKPTESSDVDLLIATSAKGLKYYGLVEQLRENLHKKVDLLDVNQLLNNKELLHEILKDGIKIYG